MYYFSDGSKYEGNYINGLMHGHGKWLSKSIEPMDKYEVIYAYYYNIYNLCRVTIKIIRTK